MLMSSDENDVKDENLELDKEETLGQVKPAWYWIKDSRGYGSVTVTMIFISFWVTTLAYVASIFEQIGPFTIRSFDVAACSTYFAPIMVLYFGRKATEAKYNSNGDYKNENNNK